MGTQPAEVAKRDRDRSERSLIWAARSLLETQNYEAIRVRDIADLAGCNHGLITHYFGSKLNLFTEVLHQLGSEVAEAIDNDGTALQLLEHPANAAWWNLLASLLNAGLDPDRILNDGEPIIDVIVERARQATGRDLSDSRSMVGFLLLMVGGYHVFGDALKDTITTDKHQQSPVEVFQDVITLIIKGLMAE